MADQIYNGSPEIESFQLESGVKKRSPRRDRMCRTHGGIYHFASRGG